MRCIESPIRLRSEGDPSRRKAESDAQTARPQAPSTGGVLRVFANDFFLTSECDGNERRAGRISPRMNACGRSRRAAESLRQVVTWRLCCETNGRRAPRTLASLRGPSKSAGIRSAKRRAAVPEPHRTADARTCPQIGCEQDVGITR
jgi:hypothetical protein